MERGNFVAVVFFALGMLVGALSVLFIARNNAIAHEQLVRNQCAPAVCQDGAMPYW